MNPTVGKVIGGNLYLRSSPSSSASSILLIPDDSDLVVWDSGSNGWFSTKYNGNNGYVMSRYVAITKDGGTCKVNTVSGSLNIRQTPSTNATVIYTAAKNKVLRLLDSSSVSGWYRVACESGSGWAQSSYLSNIIQPSASTIDYNASGITNALTPLGYATDYESILLTIPSGTSLSLLSVTYNNQIWYKTAYSGTLGFVHGGLITL